MAVALASLLELNTFEFPLDNCTNLNHKWIHLFRLLLWSFDHRNNKRKTPFGK